MIRHGVEKTIKRSGKVGGETPKPGQLCYVHYSGMLSDGTVFDSSRTAGRGPLQFNVGQGQVIPGWDLTVATMLKGEKCVVKIAPEYAYGNSGAPPVLAGRGRGVSNLPAWMTGGAAAPEPSGEKRGRDGEELPDAKRPAPDAHADLRASMLRVARADPDAFDSLVADVWQQIKN